MILSADFFESVLKTLKTTVSPSDQRSSARVGIRAQVRITRFNGKVMEQPQLVWARDVSRNGIGILSPKNMKVGQYFVLEMPREEAEPVRIICQAKRRQKIDDQLCIIGAVFQSALDNSDAADAIQNESELVAIPDKEQALIDRIRSEILT